MNQRSKFNLLSLLGIALLLIVAQLTLFVKIRAKDIPFQGDRHNVDGNFEGANSIYAADIDADGDIDILATAYDQNDVVWWENENGDGSNWDDHIIAAEFGGARAVYAADVDGDGDLDILGAAQTDGDIKWWEALPGNNWTEHTVNNEFAGAHSLLALDMDADGDMDVVAAALDDDQIAWWENANGLGTTWTEHLVADDLSRAPSVYAADLDGDGDLDIVAPSQFGDELFWWQNSNGNGTQWTKESLKDSWHNARAAFAADIDNDGQLDIVAVGDNDLLWWENENGDGSDWNENTIDDSFEGPTSVYATDIDFDGDVDVMASGRSNNEITWWENQDGSGGTWSKHTIDDGFGLAEAVYAADLDSDGDIDLLGVASGDDDVSWWENDTIHGNPTFVVENKEPIGTGVDGAAAAVSADLDRDGDLDVLGVGSQNGQLTWWQNNGDGWQSDTIDNGFDGARAVMAADLDGDSDLDVLAAAFEDDDITWWENQDGDGSDWNDHGIEGSFNGSRSVYAADIDADGDIDVLSAAYTAQDVTWWENDGTGLNWSIHTIDDSFDNASAVMAADIDSDGDLDIVAAGDDNITWWENGADWANHSITSDFNGAQAIAALDIDGDGNLDVLGAAGDDNQITWWENQDGDGSDWNEEVIQSDFSGASSVTAADLDQDGDMDVIGSASSANSVSWWENLNGNGQKWSLHSVDDTFSGASHVSIGDINDDGKPDILAAASESDEISWYPNQGGQITLATTATAPASFMAQGSQDDVFKIVATHNGESGDRHAELVRLQLFWQQDDNQPLTDAQANALVERLHIYLDTGSGIFEVQNDGLVASIEDLLLTNGIMTIEFTDGDINVELEQNQPRTYFIVVELTANAGTQNPNAFNVRHLPNNGAADDRDFDIPLDLTYQPNVSDRVLAVDPALLNYLYLPVVERE